MSELERMVAQKGPLPSLWQHVLGDTMGMTLKSLSSAFSRYLLTPDIANNTEIERLQVALQICAFYNDLDNEEIAQNIMTLLMDTSSKHTECLEFLSFVTSVAASSKSRLYLQTFAIQATNSELIQAICKKVITDNCVNSSCYSELYPIAKNAPQFILLVLRHVLTQIVHKLRILEEAPAAELDFALNLVEQNGVFLTNSDVLHPTLFCILVSPLVRKILAKKNGTKKSERSKAKKSQANKELEGKLFKKIFSKLSTGDPQVDWSVVKEISEFMSHHKDPSTDGKLWERSTDRLNQLILVTSHNKPVDKEMLIKIIQNNEFGGFMLQSLT